MRLKNSIQEKCLPHLWLSHFFQLQSTAPTFLLDIFTTESRSHGEITCTFTIYCHASGRWQRQRTSGRLRDLISLYADVKLFHFFSSPGSFAQEREARLDAGIKLETPDVNDTAQVFPPKMFDEFSQDHFQCFSVKRIFCRH